MTYDVCLLEESMTYDVCLLEESYDICVLTRGEL